MKISVELSNVKQDKGGNIQERKGNLRNGKETAVITHSFKKCFVNKYKNKFHPWICSLPVSCSNDVVYLWDGYKMIGILQCEL